MARIWAESLICLLLWTVCAPSRQSCKKAFSQHKLEALVPQQISKGDVLLKVKFNDCNLGKHIKLSTSDNNFGIHSNGKVYATHSQAINSMYHFKVLAKDLVTHKKWKLPIYLVPSLVEPKEVFKEECPTIHFAKMSRSRRQKREWIIPPVAVVEHKPPLNKPIGRITSDFELKKKITYVLSGPGADQPPVKMFVIDPVTGDLSITGEVDRETNPQFVLTGKALDSFGNLVESPLNLVINVIDINDNPPIFSSSMFKGSIEELSSFGTLVMKLNATDKDLGKNAKIAYRILSQGGKQMFVAESNGEIKTMTSNLDREAQDLYTLLVEARDMDGNPGGLFSTTNLQIQIMDVNDNFPTVEKEEYEVFIQENTQDDEVMRIKVFDADQKFTDNWWGNFEIIEGNEGGHFRFELDEETNEGILILQKELNYEESTTRNLSFQVTNRAAYHSSILTGGGGGKSIKLTVNVKDQKEGFSFKPTKKRINLSENTMKVGQSLGIYPAISADTGKQIKGVRYIKGIDLAKFFKINPKTSEITLAKIPDRESEYVVDGKYTATILAIDDEGPVPKTSTGTMVFHVKDENDNTPIISDLEPCMCDRAESLTLTAKDLDSYPNAEPFTFKLSDAPGITEQWKILRRDDTSMELISLKKLWPSTFTVPIKVEDNQGAGNFQDVNVHVVECSGNDLSCSKKSMITGSKDSRLGAAAIGLMILGALLLLLVPLLLLLCNCGGYGGIRGGSNLQQIPIDSLGTMERKNIEGGGEWDTKTSLLHVGSTDNNGTGNLLSEVDAAKGGSFLRENNLSTLANVTSRGLYTVNNQFNSGHMTSGDMYTINPAMPGGVNIRSSNYWYSNMEPNMNKVGIDQGKYGTMSGGIHVNKMGRYIKEKIKEHNLMEETSPTHDTLLVYDYEGEGSLAGSIDSCNFIEDKFQIGDSYLNDLDVKFKTLADICTGKVESQKSTVTVDRMVQQQVVNREQTISSSSGGSFGLNVVPDSTLMRKNYVVTTTINPVEDVVPVVPDQVFDQQNVVVTKHVNTIPRRVNVIDDPSLAHQNVLVTKMVNAGAGGFPDVIFDPTVTHQNVIMSNQLSTSPRGSPGVVFNPSQVHQNTVVTQVVDGGYGGISSPSIAPSHAFEKSMTQTRLTQVVDSQGRLVNPLPAPVIHKNVTLSRSGYSDMGELQGSHIAGDVVVQKTKDSRTSLTSPDNSMRRSVTKVTKVAQVMHQ
ncbi:desmoglein-2-like [Narcine bancroftii]|uniref:desmoglein-2-like n=1 Tax=Narcine bancroftii TaxID=1343680 RepID=UPI00383107FA